MAYGMEITTTAGLLSVGQIRSARLFFSKTETGTSGSFTVAGFDATKGHIFVRSINGVFEPVFEFDNATKELSWSQFQSTATEFLFQFFLIR